ncbi:hypothetical protein SprV_0100016300 [Sparganum proliferum]
MVPKTTSGDWSPTDDYRALNIATIPDRYPVSHLQDFAGALFGKAVFSRIDLRCIDHVLRGLSFVYAYTDDLLMSSWNEEEHKEHLVLVFDRLDKCGVVINPSKCVLGVPSLEFLSHHVDSEGLRPLPSKVEAIRDFPPPTSKRQLLRFLGMVNFCHRFLPNCADLMQPLTNMLSGPKGPLELTGEALNAFERSLDCLTSANIPMLQLKSQFGKHVFSLLPAETRYSTFGRELLAIYLTVKHFRHFVAGRDFTVFTDHKPLFFVLRSHADKYNPREIAHLDYISQFTTDIRHIDGTKNEVADMLSRPSPSSLQLSHWIDLCAMAAERQRVGCPRNDSVSGLQFKDGLSHPEIRASQKLLAERFVWPGMNKDVKAWAQSCLSCQCNKVQRRNKSPTGTFPSPDARFSRVHLDVVGPLPPSNGFTHFLTCVDRYTRSAEAIPLLNAQAETILKAFASRWVAMFGAPSTVTTDRGA